jgi:hypothetical protein
MQPAQQGLTMTIPRRLKVGPGSLKPVMHVRVVPGELYSRLV